MTFKNHKPAISTGAQIHALVPLALLFAVILFGLALGTGAVRAADAKTLRFAPLPMQNPETVMKQVRPLLAHLERELGLEIEVVYSTDYADMLALFRAGDVDMAYLGPLPYMALRDQYPDAEPLVRFREASGATTYTCSVVGWSLDALPDLSDSAGQTVALTQPLSTCGYLSTSAMLRQAGTDIETTWYGYLGAHDKVALSVIRGEHHLGGLKTAIARKYEHLGLIALAETGPLPSFALTANRATMPFTLMQQVVTVLTAMEPEGRDQALMADWGDNVRNGAVAARDSDYDTLRSMGGWQD
ncbi:MAG: PhnD/SsuA/transferrin family substrate-binding protein, partial [Rhodospirillaceae bacterium]